MVTDVDAVPAEPLDVTHEIENLNPRTTGVDTETDAHDVKLARTPCPGGALVLSDAG